MVTKLPVPVTLHKRQWVITTRDRLPQKENLLNFKSLTLAPGHYLHHEPSLLVVASANRVVLGNVLADAPTEPLHHVPGRFVSVSFPWLSLDATGLMGVYYFEGEQEIVCGSSQALIADIIGATPKGRTLNWHRGMNWDPLPIARLDGLRRLYCDQILNLESRTFEQRPRGLRGDLSEQESVDRLAQYFSDLAARLKTQPGRIFLPLTAGRDSRTLLSALLSTGVDFQVFTWVFNKDSQQDADVAARLCWKYGIIHHRIEADGSSTEAQSLYQQHISGCVDDADGHRLIPGGFYQLFGTGDVILIGAIFEIGRRFYAEQFRPPELFTHQRAADAIAGSFGEEQSEIKTALRDWLRYRSTNPIVGMDLTDTFYLDQRIGARLGALSLGYDALQPDFLHLANSWDCIEWLMATTPERRANGTIQVAVMDRLVPGISNAAPFNPGSFISRVTDRVRSAIIGTPLEEAVRGIVRFARQERR